MLASAAAAGADTGPVVPGPAAGARRREVLIPPLPMAGRAGDGRRRRGSDRIIRLSGETMGTVWRVSTVAGDGPAATMATDDVGLRAGIQAEFDDVVGQMSTWEADSDLSRFNRAPAGSRQRLPDGLFHVLQVATRIAIDTGGACDPAAGALVDLWGFGPGSPFLAEGFQPPTAAAIATALQTLRATGGPERLALDLATGTALQAGGVRLDLSGIAKGYAVDRVSRWLTRHGFADHLVDAGGELRGAGLRPDGQPWWVAIEAPDARWPVETLVALVDLSIATSGDTRRHFIHGGRRYSHTIDPRTGQPVDDRVASATVIHPDCIDADALATALTVLGPDAGLAWAERSGLAARLLIRDRRAAGGHRELTSQAWRAMQE